MKSISQLFLLTDYYPCYIESLVTQCMQWCDGYSRPILIPMTSWLPCPHVPSLASIATLYGITCFVPSNNNQYFFCNHGQMDIAMHHLPSKRLLKLFCGEQTYNIVKAFCHSVDRKTLVRCVLYQCGEPTLRFVSMSNMLCSSITATISKHKRFNPDSAHISTLYLTDRLVEHHWRTAPVSDMQVK